MAETQSRKSKKQNAKRDSGPDLKGSKEDGKSFSQ